MCFFDPNVPGSTICFPPKKHPGPGAYTIGTEGWCHGEAEEHGTLGAPGIFTWKSMEASGMLSDVTLPGLISILVLPPPRIFLSQNEDLFQDSLLKE